MMRISPKIPVINVPAWPPECRPLVVSIAKLNIDLWETEKQKLKGEKLVVQDRKLNFDKYFMYIRNHMKLFRCSVCV